MAFKRKFSKRPAKRTRRAKRATTTRRMTALIRRTVLRVAEPKYRTLTQGKVEIYHNCFHSVSGINTGFLSLLNQAGACPPQGVGDTQRVGDQINISRFDIKMLIGQKADRPNVTFRYLVLSVPKGSAINYATWFDQQTGNVLLDDPNVDFVKVIKQGIWRPNEAGLGGTGGDEYTFVKRLSIRYKKNLKFGPVDAASTHNDNDLYLSIMAYDAFGSLISDNIAYIQCASTMHFKDP